MRAGLVGGAGRAATSRGSDLLGDGRHLAGPVVSDALGPGHVTACNVTLAAAFPGDHSRAPLKRRTRPADRYFKPTTRRCRRSGSNSSPHPEGCHSPPGAKNFVPVAEQHVILRHATPPPSLGGEGAEPEPQNGRRPAAAGRRHVSKLHRPPRCRENSVIVHVRHTAIVLATCGNCATVRDRTERSPAVLSGRRSRQPNPV